MNKAAGVPSPPEAGRRVLVLGGARSGKSLFAESLAAEALAAGSLAAEGLAVGEPAVTYVATSTVGGEDPEWQRRIAAHRSRRPSTWGTIETLDLAATLRDAEGALVVDSLTAWLTGVIERAGAWDASTGATATVSHAMERLVEAWRATRARVVVVSDEVGLGVVPATPSARLFRDELGTLNQRMAAAADAVWFVVAGIPIRLR